MDLYDVMTTTFAARDFTDAPLPDETLHRILDHARFAPSGGNRQGWSVLVIRDSETRRSLAELSEPALKQYVAQLRRGENPWNTIEPSQVTPEEAEAVELDWPLLDTLVSAPALLVVCVDVGVLAGYPGWDAVASDYPELARLRLEDPIHFQPPGGESGADVLARARAFLAARQAAERDVLVVCHGVVNKFIRAATRGISGGDIIALGEDQDVVYRLDGAAETELRAPRDAHAHGDVMPSRVEPRRD